MSAKIAFSWQGLPQYAARQLSLAIKQLGQPCVVIGTRPQVPIEGMEACLGQSIHWVEPSAPLSWADLGLAVPKFFFQAGWSCPSFNALGEEVRRSGGKVCLLMDNQWRGNSRQYLGGMWFRLWRQRQFAAVLVPGQSGQHLAQWYGFSAKKIFTGLYGADPQLFYSDQPLSQRPKRILYVGQYIERKGCIPLAKAFATLATEFPDWELWMFGSGPLQSQLPVHPQIKVHGFVQPEQLGGLYRQARIFALPSYQEAWGLVVHEAALSGCQLLLSTEIGAGLDFANVANAARFTPGVLSEMAQAMRQLMQMPEGALMQAQATSVESGRGFGPQVFATTVSKIVQQLQ